MRFRIAMLWAAGPGPERPNQTSRRLGGRARPGPVRSAPGRPGFRRGGTAGCAPAPAAARGPGPRLPGGRAGRAPPPAAVPAPAVAGSGSAPGPGGPGRRSMRRRCRPTVRGMCTAHCCRSNPVSFRAGPYSGASSGPARPVPRVREPVAPVEAGASRAQVQSFALRPQNHGHGSLFAASGSDARPGATAWRSRHSVAAPTPHRRQVQDAREVPQTDAVHVIEQGFRVSMV